MSITGIFIISPKSQELAVFKRPLDCGAVEFRTTLEFELGLEAFAIGVNGPGTELKFFCNL